MSIKFDNQNLGLVGYDSLKWAIRYLHLATYISQWSKDPSTQVGAVIVRKDKTVASMGFNGFPRGVKDLKERYDDRSQKYPMVVHAEMNAVVAAHTRLDHCVLYSTLCPCSQCAATIIQAGIGCVVTWDVGNERWTESMRFTEIMFEEGGVTLQLISPLLDLNKHPYKPKV